MQADERGLLSELEGAILCELAHRGEQTAFRVRRSFASSPSLEWRGSAGAVYAAIKRLEEAGMIAGQDVGDKRASRLLSITGQGRAMLHAWACDPQRAVSVGIDPMRLRAGLWQTLDVGERIAVAAQMRAALQASIATLESYSNHDDLVERTGLDLAIRLQRSRLEWLQTLVQVDKGRGSLHEQREENGKS
ncbi:DNA-binding transcriptional regulator, PadR family [Sphingomonas guangdongensis]|uniref:DNA-binding transcriptional regulator, PadR family n=1 Tax=Sphingomonas guangdongensis TaxID=1141890 RepID=A0A285QG97_9SPHN|nr:helix-turn-helix transcriptional regulator [Sphingomonas guangdongensis]SOB79147.1 DNA-binding transcriptional regulator, PadR family [Sphingomonas guangdongensis]